MLVKYHETVDPKSPNVTLFSPADSPHPYFAEYGWVPPRRLARRSCPTATRSGRSQGSGTLTPATPVTLTWDNGQGLVFKRTISIDDDYMFKIVDEVENKRAPPRSRSRPTRASIATARRKCRATGSCTKA